MKNQNPDVDAWFVKKAHPLTDAMQLARQTILAADRRVTESIKWSTPTFAFNGNIVSFNPSKKLVSLLFHRGAEIPGKFKRLKATASWCGRCASPISPKSKRARRN